MMHCVSPYTLEQLIYMYIFEYFAKNLNYLVFYSSKYVKIVVLDV